MLAEQIPPEPARQSCTRRNCTPISARFRRVIFEVHSAGEITRDLVLAHRFLNLQISEEEKALEPVVDWHNEPDRGCTAVKICTWDRAALFNTICGSFSAAGLSILSARIFTRSDAIVLDTFYVVDARTGALANREERDRFEVLLVVER